MAAETLRRCLTLFAEISNWKNSYRSREKIGHMHSAELRLKRRPARSRHSITGSTGTSASTLQDTTTWMPDCHISRFIRPGRPATSNLPQPLFALGGYICSRNPANSHFPTNCGIIRAMNQATLIEVLRTYDAALRENGATGLFIFGSRATGVPRSDSDLDLFIDYDPVTKVPNVFRLMQIEEDISKALGIPVTITTRNALHPLMKESIERDAI
jgi:uncharacterized protein